MNKLYLSLLCSFIVTIVTAQTLLDPVTHPKFQNPIPSPAKITVGATTTTMQMAQTTQWLGLVDANNAPLQTTVWGYGLSTGAVSYPGPTLVANSNSTANIEWLNNLPQTHLLPLDSTYHRAVATAGVPAVVHLHGAHVDAASDGNTDAWYTNSYAQKGVAWTKKVYTYGNTQEGATIWYHDHALGMTRLNVYAGLAGFYFLNDTNDQAVSLPRGAYDREILVQDRMFTSTGQLFMPTDPALMNGGMPEFFGDFIVVNGVVWPYMNVEPRKYRLRLLNGSDSRAYVFGFSNGASFFQIGTDDGKLNNPVSMTKLTMMPGERAEVIVDFSTMNGQTITLLNTGTDGPWGNPGSLIADPVTTGQIMQFRVNQPLNAATPDVTLTTATNLRPTLGAIADVGTSVKTRKLGLFEGTDNLGRILPMLGIIDPTSPLDGSLTWHDPITENVNMNDIETWEIYNTTADAHPVHLHLVSFQILSKQTFIGAITNKAQLMHNGAMGMGSVLSNITLTGTPQTFTPAQSGWKDTHILMPGEMMKIKAKFDLSGEYVWHCHILSHEDHDMMRRLVVLPAITPCAPDILPPTMTACPANMNLTTTGTTATASWTAPTATDNCTTPTVSFVTSPTVNLTNGGAFPIGTTTVSYMAMDAVNNMAACSFTVTVTNPCATDATAPTLSACPATLNLTTTGTTATASWTAPTATDNCGTPSVSFTTSPTTGLTNGGAFPVGTTTVTYTATDTKNNTATCRFNVVVTNTNPCTNDITPPVMTACPANMNLTTTGTTAVASWTAPTATDACGTPSVTFTTMPTVGLTNGGTFPTGTTMVTYMAMDASNNMVMCSFNVTVTNPCTNDLTPPVLTACPTNKNLTTTGTTAVASWTAPTATDACGTASVAFTTSPTAGLTNGGAFPVGTTTVTYTATDAKNNTSTCSFAVTVTNTNSCTNDVTPPSLVCPANLSLTTTGTTALASWTTPTATDNCGTPVLTFTTSPTIALTNGGAFPIGTTTVIYMAMDGSNNMSTCSFNVVVTQTNSCATDAIAPVLTACPANKALTTASTTAVASWTAPTATDNCGTPTVSFTTMPTTGLTNGGAFPIGTTMVTYMAMDAKNNMTTCSFNVAVTTANQCATDITKPTLTACPANLNLTTTGTTAVASWTAPTATDACSTPSVSYTTSPTIGLLKGGAFPIGTTTVTYTAKDAKSNKSTCSFNVVVTNPCANDVTAPVLTACPANLSLTTTGSSVIATWTAPTATDACSTPSVSYTTSPTIGLLKGGAFPIGTTTVTYTAKDAKSNKSTCSFNVVVTNPCANDVTAPVLTACPANLSLTTTGSSVIATWTAPTATDACSTPSVSYTTSPTIGLLKGGAFPIGTTTVTYTAKDAKSNKSTCSFNVVVTSSNPCAVDVTVPVLTACPANLSLTTTGSTAVATWTAPTATDACSTPTVTYATSPTTGLLKGGSFPIGTTIVTYTAKDAKSNKSTCSFNVVVTNPCANDVTAPVLTACPASLNLTTTGSTAVATWTAPTATDVCSTPSVSYTTSPTTGLLKGGSFPVGTTTVTYTAKDAKSNKSTCSFNVVVTSSNPCAVDVTAPVLTVCPANLSLTTTGSSATATWTAPTATDACSTPSVTYATSPTTGLLKGGSFPIGTTAVTYTAKDAKSNKSTCSFTVTVTNPCANDVTPPTLTACPATLNLTTTGSKATATWTAPTATDVCSSPSVSYATAPTTGLQKGGSFPIGTTTVTYTAKDAKGNKSTCSFKVVVTSCSNDVTAPVLTACPANLTVVTATITATKATVSWTAPTATDACSTPSVSYATAPTTGLTKGGSFPLGTTTVTYTVKDAKGNKSTCSFTVTVSNTAPLVSASQGVVSLTAKAESNRTFLSWVSNLNGHQNERFIVQKLNVITQVFEDIATVTNTNMNQNFASFTHYDNAPTEGDNTYRIKAILIDGSMKMSENRIVNFKDLNTVRIFPNPANDVLNIDLTSYKNEVVNVYLYNTLGQQKMSKQVEQVNNSLLELDITNMTVGTYLVRITSKDRREVVKNVVITH